MTQVCYLSACHYFSEHCDKRNIAPKLQEVYHKHRTNNLVLLSHLFVDDINNIIFDYACQSIHSFLRQGLSDDISVWGEYFSNSIQSVTMSRVIGGISISGTNAGTCLCENCFLNRFFNRLSQST